MNYGLYSSATGVLANSYRQDVIANNLANVETVGFKKDLVSFREYLTEARLRGLNPRRHSNAMLEELGGGLAVAPTKVDLSQGDLEQTGNPTDVALDGAGFFAVRHGRQVMLTRDGRLAVNRDGQLIRITGGEPVLDEKLNPINVTPGATIAMGKDGTVWQNGQMAGRMGVFDVSRPEMLVKKGSLLFEVKNAEKEIRPGSAEVRGGMLERANVDPATSLAELMETQRQLEANANMIRMHDQMLARVVNDVGKIS